MYLRVSMQGQLPGGERWSINPAYHFNAILAPSWDQASADAITTALLTAIDGTTLPASMQQLLTQSCNITGWRLEGRGEDEALLGVSESAYVSPLIGTTPITKPLQTSVVLSLRTDTPGASGRGRLYFPALGATLQTTSGRLNGPAPATALEDLSGLLTTIGQTIQDNAGVFPWTSVLLGVRSLKTHTTHTVTRVQLGDILDTQRRRRDAIVENYSSSVYPVP